MCCWEMEVTIIESEGLHTPPIRHSENELIATEPSGKVRNNHTVRWTNKSRLVLDHLHALCVEMFDTLKDTVCECVMISLWQK